MPEENKKLSPLFAGKTFDKKFHKSVSSLMIGAGMAGIAGAMAAAVTGAIMGNPLAVGLDKPFAGVFAEKPLTAEQAAKLIAQVMDDKLDPRLFDDEQQTAARGHIRANIGDLSQLKQSFLHAASSRKKNADEVSSRIDAIMETGDFTRLMNEHSAVWREQQRVSRGQQVATALTASHAQIKAPPRASFTRNRNTVTA